MDNLEKRLTECKSECIERWRKDDSGDQRLSEFEARFRDWFLSLPEGMQEEVLDLMPRFEYFTHESTKDYLQVLFQQLVDQDIYNFDDTIVTHIPKRDGSQNSSILYLTEFGAVNAIPNPAVIIDITSISREELANIRTIVYVDDMCGSGDTFVKELSGKCSYLEQKQIVYAVIFLMRQGRESIINAAEDLGLDVKIISCIEKEAFYPSGESGDTKALLKKRAIEEGSSKLGIGKDYAFGYKGIQSLVSFHNNTPNTTFGFIWKNSGEYRPIFPRMKNETPDWKEMRLDKENRKRKNYQSRERTRA